MKDSLKNALPLYGKNSLWFVPDRKSVSTTRNEGFVEKYVPAIRKNASSGTKIENGFH